MLLVFKMSKKKRVRLSSNLYENLLVEDVEEEGVSFCRGTRLSKDDLAVFRGDTLIEVVKGCFHVSLGVKEPENVSQTRELGLTNEFEPRVRSEYKELYVALSNFLVLDDPIVVVENSHMELKVSDLTGTEVGFLLDTVGERKMSLFVKRGVIHIKILLNA